MSHVPCPTRLRFLRLPYRKALSAFLRNTEHCKQHVLSLSLSAFARLLPRNESKPHRSGHAELNLIE